MAWYWILLWGYVLIGYGCCMIALPKDEEEREYATPVYCLLASIWPVALVLLIIGLPIIIIHFITKK